MRGSLTENLGSEHDAVVGWVSKDVRTVRRFRETGVCVRVGASNIYFLLATIAVLAASRGTLIRGDDNWQEGRCRTGRGRRIGRWRAGCWFRKEIGMEDGDFGGFHKLRICCKGQATHGRSRQPDQSEVSDALGLVHLCPKAGVPHLADLVRPRHCTRLQHAFFPIWANPPPWPSRFFPLCRP